MEDVLSSQNDHTTLIDCITKNQFARITLNQILN